MKVRTTLAFVLLSVVALCGTPASAQSDVDLFSPDILQDIVLRINTRDLDDLRATYDQNTYYPADLQWGGLVVRNIAVRSRGRSTRNPVKLGLRLDMDHYVSGQTLVGLDALVLDNAYQDASMLHEHAAMTVFSRLGFVAPRTAFARLFINDEYQGVYTIIEEPNENFVRQRFGADKGYLFEYHWREPYFFDELGDDLDVYWDRFEARTHERDAPGVLYDPIRELVRVEEGESLSRWRERISEHLNLEQFVRLVAVEEFLSEFDGITGHAGMNNFYLYRPHDSERFIFIPWDRDSSFLDADGPIDLRIDQNRVLRQALAFTDLRALYLSQLRQAAQLAATDDWLEGMIKASGALIATAAKADTRQHYTEEERLLAVQDLVTFTKRRPYSVLDQVQLATSN